MKKLLQRWFGAGPQFARVETVTEERLQEMFLNVPDSPGWKATLAVLDSETLEAVDAAVDERLSNEQMRFRLGQVAGLLAFRQTLLDREVDARKRQK